MRSRLIWSFSLLGALAGVLLFVGRAQAASLGFTLHPDPAPGTAPDDVRVLVLKDGTTEPLADAFVSLVDTLAEDTAERRSRTGADGTLLFKGGMDHARALSVSKEGFSSIAVVGVRSPRITVHLKEIPAPAPERDPTSDVPAGQVIGSGIMTGWGSSGFSAQADQVVHLGLVFRAMSASDLLHFDSGAFVSPLVDTINVFGRREIPSNLVLPKQDVSFVFGSIHLNKPRFRLPVDPGRTLRLAGAQATIKVKDLMSLAQGGTATLEMMNKIKFTRVGLSAPITPVADFQTNIHAGMALRTQHQVRVTAAPFAGDVIVAAAVDMNGDRDVIMPTDLKVATSPSKPVTVSSAEASVGGSHDVITVAVSEKARRLTGIITAHAGGTVMPGQYLPADAIADAPAVPTSMTLRPTPTGLSAALFEAGKTVMGTVYALPSAGVTQVPSAWLADASKASAFSVVSLDFGATFDERAVDGETAMRGLQRFSRSTGMVVKPQL